MGHKSDDSDTGATNADSSVELQRQEQLDKIADTVLDIRKHGKFLGRLGVTLSGVLGAISLLLLNTGGNILKKIDDNSKAVTTIPVEVAKLTKETEELRGSVNEVSQTAGKMDANLERMSEIQKSLKTLGPLPDQVVEIGTKIDENKREVDDAISSLKESMLANSTSTNMARLPLAEANQSKQDRNGGVEFVFEFPGFMPSENQDAAVNLHRVDLELTPKSDKLLSELSLHVAASATVGHALTVKIWTPNPAAFNAIQSDITAMVYFSEQIARNP